ncbi:NADP-dependent oxidoreductase [Streptomyces sp. NPDC050617]|uniref:MDR family NADP-dependent oxidoreductase n=1 Tax=Streptomyces sp. NPDC050617 TaxID=3154628 RepID=UPI0034474C77
MTTASIPATHREVRLAAHVEGRLTDGHFEIAEVPVPRPGPGELLVRNKTMAVAAVMRTLMAAESPVPMPHFKLGEALTGPSVAEVAVAGSGTGFAPGDLVTTQSAGWREYAVVSEGEAQRVDPDLLPDPGAYLSQGPTAYMGIVRTAEVRSGDTVFVSGAAGGVGTLAGQIARLRGAARVIGSTSSQAKADVLTKELGYDAVVLRGAGPIEEQLRAAAPDGIDAVFDNVGGEQLQEAVKVANRGARIALIGALSGQLGEGALATFDTLALVANGITLRGGALYDNLDVIPEWHRAFGRGLRDGTLTFPHARLSGIESAPRALRELTEGRHIGAVLVEM